MPEPPQSLHVTGTVTAGSDGTILVLSRRLDGHDTFLTGQLQLAGDDTLMGVRILTFDDVTVLRPVDHSQALPTGHWTGTLNLPHGWRTRPVPEDLMAAAERKNRDLGSLDPAELRYALTFLGEAAAPGIRQARIEAIVRALPQPDHRS